MVKCWLIGCNYGIYIYIYIHTNIHIYIYIYISIHVSIYIYICINEYRNIDRWVSTTLAISEGCWGLGITATPWAPSPRKTFCATGFKALWTPSPWRWAGVLRADEYHLNTYRHMLFKRIYTYIYIYLYMYLYIYICICVYMYIYILFV